MREGRYQAKQTQDNAKEIRESCVDDLDKYMVDSKERCEAKASKIKVRLPILIYHHINNF